MQPLTPFPMAAGNLPRGAVVVALLALALTGCGRAPATGATECAMTETLSEINGEVVVFVNDCAEGFVRPATAADLARLEAPL